jgi:hypothetical protein
MSVSCECCVLSGRGFCDGPIPRPEESYRLWCVIVCELETSRMRRPWPAFGCCPRERRRRYTFLQASVIMQLTVLTVITSRDETEVELTVREYVYKTEQGHNTFQKRLGTQSDTRSHIACSHAALERNIM